MIGHPSEQQLLAFQDHRLGDRRRRKLAGHLSGCQRCRNLMQSHRSVRGVFALEAPFAPDGVLQRVLASRASGVAVVLPVAEPDARRHGGDPLRLLAIAAGVVISVVAAVQVVPVTALKEAWGNWSGMIADWKPLGEGGVLDIRYPETPTAKTAVLDPTRLRPMSATYLVPPWRSDGSILRLHVEVRRVGAEWHVTQHYGSPSATTTRFDTASLELSGWTRVNVHGQNEYTKIHRLERSGTAFRFEFEWTGSPPMPFVRREPAKVVVGEYTGFANKALFTRGASMWVVLSTVPFKLGWAGSVRELDRDRPPEARFDIPPETYLVTDSEPVDTRLGTFDAWEVSRLIPTELRIREVYWFRKSDGLMLKMERGKSGEMRTQYEIESVTYH